MGLCGVCPLGPPKVVPGYGTGGGIVIVGESPGRQEVLKGRPFVGPSGQLLRAALKGLGHDPDAVYYTNSVLCHAPTKPEKGATQACNGRLQQELQMAQPQKILALGANAMQALQSPGKAVTITKNRGRGFWYQVGDRQVYCIGTFHPSAVLRDPDLFRDFCKDIEKLLSREAIANPTRPEVYIMWKAEQAKRWLPDLMKASAISCDIETTGFSVVTDTMLSLGFGAKYKDGSGGCAYIIPNPVLRDPEVFDLCRSLLTDNYGAVVFHNGKFDLKFLSRDFKQKIRPPRFRDTMLMHYALDERPMGRFAAHGLKDLSRYYFDADDYHFDFEAFFKLSPKTKKDWERLFYYQGLDCWYTINLYDIFQEDLEREQAATGYRGLEVLDRFLYPASFMLSEVESAGVPVDVPYLTRFADNLAVETDELTEEIQFLVKQATGMDEFNPASPVQVKRLIYDEWRTAKQNDAYRRDAENPTSKEVLQRLITDVLTDPIQQKIVQLILDWRANAKMLGTYANGLLKAAEHDSKIRPNFALHGTSTGRLSCSNPNLQNLPAKVGEIIHTAFVAPAGYSYVCADYSQLELRVAGYYSGDPTLIDIFANGKDIHGETASRLFSKDPLFVTGLERKLTKTMVFGVIYGRGPESLIGGKEMQYLVEQQHVRRWTMADGKAFQQKFLDTYPGLRDWLKGMHRSAIEHHYVETPFGRRRRFPLILPNYRAEILRQAANMPIQSLASDICLLAMTKLHDLIQNLGGQVLLSIHDEIQFLIPDQALDTALNVIRSTMEDVPLKTDIPFRVEIKRGVSWGDAKRIA